MMEIMKLTKKETIKALEHCNDNSGSCDGCPLCGNSMCFKIVRINALNWLKENEPAPSANDTSSTNENILHLDDSTLLRICQGIQKIYSRFNESYDNDLQSDEGIRLFGEGMGMLEALIDAIEQLKGGDGNAN